MDAIRDSNPWTVIALEGCLYSKLLLEFFKSRNLKVIYNELDIPLDNRYVLVVMADHDNKKHILDQLAPITNNHRTFPLVFRKKKFLGGYDTFIEEFGNPI